MTPREIADGWVRAYLRNSPASPAAHQRAQDRMIDLVAEQPEVALEAVSHIFDLTDDEWVLTNLGAGPIETLLGSSPRATLKLLAGHPRTQAVAISISNVWTSSLDQLVVEELARIRADLDG